MNPKLVEYRERMAAALKRLGELQAMETRSTDHESEIDTLLNEVNDLGPKIVREQQIEDTAKRQQEFAPSTRKSGQTPIEPNGKPKQDERGEPVDRRSFAEKFVDSDAVKNYRGNGRGEPFAVRSFRPEFQAENVAMGGPIDRRDLIYTGILPADYLGVQRVPGLFRGDDLQGSLRDVLINGTTTNNSIIYFRETAFTNNAAAVAEADTTAGGAASSGLKPESALEFEQDTANVVTIAHWIPITRQTLEDAGELRTYVEQRLLDGLRLVESDSLLNGAGAPDMTGLLNTTGVQDLDTAVYFTGSPVTDAGSANENFNRILRAKTLIRTVGRARANFVVINPEDAETFLTATNGNQNYYGAGPFSGNATTNLWGLRVVEDENITAGTALVGDGRMAAVWDRMQAQILIDTINDQFIRNMLTILAEERLALTVFRPQAFAVVELAA